MSRRIGTVLLVMLLINALLVGFVAYKQYELEYRLNHVQATADAAYGTVTQWSLGLKFLLQFKLEELMERGIDTGTIDAQEEFNTVVLSYSPMIPTEELSEQNIDRRSNTCTQAASTR